MAIPCHTPLRGRCPRRVQLLQRHQKHQDPQAYDGASAGQPQFRKAFIFHSLAFLPFGAFWQRQELYGSTRSFSATLGAFRDTLYELLSQVQSHPDPQKNICSAGDLLLPGESVGLVVATLTLR
jgi:hypothetical protein